MPHFWCHPEQSEGFPSTKSKEPQQNLKQQPKYKQKKLLIANY
jgi:hypothetical protein